MFRSEIKDEFAKIIAKLFVNETPAGIARIVEQQLHAYKYIFPTSKVSMLAVLVAHRHSFVRVKLMRESQNGLTSGLAKRSKPYRNDRIISVISLLYFTGGPSSFASRFSDLFPRVDGSYHGRMEMPIVMTALVATAVRVFYVVNEEIPIMFVSFMSVYMNGARGNTGPLALHRTCFSMYTSDTLQQWVLLRRRIQLHSII